VVRLRRSNPNRPGYTRRRRGRGFSYHDQTGAAITDPVELERIQAMVIPPAWRDVWICPDPRGRIQAVGTDAAGRRQYRYHDVWRAQRDAAKFDHVLEVGACLPKVRDIVAEHLRERGLSCNRIMAAAVRLLGAATAQLAGTRPHLRGVLSQRGSTAAPLLRLLNVGHAVLIPTGPGVTAAPDKAEGTRPRGPGRGNQARD